MVEVLCRNHHAFLASKRGNQQSRRTQKLRVEREISRDGTTEALLELTTLDLHHTQKDLRDAQSQRHQRHITEVRTSFAWHRDDPTTDVFKSARRVALDQNGHNNSTHGTMPTPPTGTMLDCALHTSAIRSSRKFQFSRQRADIVEFVRPLCKVLSVIAHILVVIQKFW